MEPLSAATALATIVSLIMDFRRERGARKALKHQDFIEWLDYHRHQETKDLILNTYHLQKEIDEILRREHADLLEAVERGNRLLTVALGRIDTFTGLAQKIAPECSLSDQAISILRQLRDSGYPEVGLSKFLGGFNLEGFSYGSTGPEFSLTDPVFAEDDLNILTDMGLLRPRISSSGGAFYGITRAASQLLDAIDTNRGAGPAAAADG